jgi:hypothetical protein
MPAATSVRLRTWPNCRSPDGAADDIVAYIIEDPQMGDWPEARREAAVPELENCRAWVGQLEGSDLGYGRLVLAGLRGMITSFLPGDSTIGPEG